MINESVLEVTALAWFEQNDWEVLNGTALERDDFRSVVLRDGNCFLWSISSA